MIMGTSTRTLSINTAFLKDIKDDNVHLNELLDAASQAVRLDRKTNVRPHALAELLSQIRDQLATHFSLEEFFGYFDDATDCSPHLSAQADILRRQHGTLYLEISELATTAESLLYGPRSDDALSKLIAGFSAFYDRLMAHEEDERDLIFRSFYDDIGVGD